LNPSLGARDQREPAPSARVLPKTAKAAVAMDITGQRTDLETLTAVIAHSQIVVAKPAARMAKRRLPGGFEAADVAILDWIAAEGRRVIRRYLPI
jgi:hypothetical protein